MSKRKQHCPEFKARSPLGSWTGVQRSQSMSFVWTDRLRRNFIRISMDGVLQS
ncbi:hypothetical protein [Roseibium album]|uniref:hypothetical protein n=1 Tax=Roseibium album TaxID=311410 RepID=UPI00130E844C|nr:hypothetical protein [Roseibium album]